MIQLIITAIDLIKSKLLYILIGMFIIGICVFIGFRIYDAGKQNGIILTEKIFAEEKLKWISKVDTIQRENDDTIKSILSSYNVHISGLEESIDKLEADLKQKPKVRYVHKYVPIETKCDIPQGFIELHNTAASGKPLNDDPMNVNASTQFTLSDVGSVVAINYYEYNKLVKQLVALQNVVIEYQNKQKELLK